MGQEIPKDVSIRHLLREAFFIPGTKKCGELFSEMTEKHIQMAIVVDEYGGVAGIVSMEDLLESIVGNIQDEFDHEEEEVMKLSETAFDVDGSMSIEDLSELLGVKLPEGEYDTIAGFIMDQLGRIPADGEQPEIAYENVTFRVMQVEDRRIDRVHAEVTPLPEDPEEDKDKPDKKADKDKPEKSHKESGEDNK